MANQIRTLDFLPEVFRTPTNSQFLGASLDLLTAQPDFTRVKGFIGNKYGYAIEASDSYVVEPTKERANYQLSPGLAFLKTDTSTARDFIDYPGLLSALKNANSDVSDPNALFANEFYSWDSFVDLDKIVNYSQYYWLPLGPDAIAITTALTTEVVTIADITGKVEYTSPNGLNFVNGLKIVFKCTTVPAHYENVEYFVEGVGTAITLIPVSEMLVTERTGQGIYEPWDIKPWDSTPWTITTFIPVTPDYLTINRNSRDRNAWSRSNRWVSQTVIDTTIQFNGVVTTNSNNTQTRATRPVIEFYGNLGLWDSGDLSAGFVSFIDTTTPDPLASIVGDSTCVLNAADSSISVTATPGSRVVFAGAEDETTRRTVYIVGLAPAGTSGDLVVTLTPAPGVSVELGSQVYVATGPDNIQGTAWRWNATAGEFGHSTGWTQSQLKTRVNQPPLFDIFDASGVSIGQQLGSTFAGTKLFSYAPGTGANDPVLGFPIAYSSVSNIGDINFEVDLNSDVYSRLLDGATVTEQVSSGFVHQSLVQGSPERRTGWVSAAAPSVQYQVFTFQITDENQTGVQCDVLASQDSETIWASTQLYLNGEFQDVDTYVVDRDSSGNTTTVIFNTTPVIGSLVSVLLLSDQTSDTAYYTIPANLQNNPFNTNITELSIGDIRSHYSTIFTNSPDTTGEQWGTNNYSNLGNLTRYGTAIIQHSAGLALPMVFNRYPGYNITDALQYSSNEYADYKNTIVDIAYREDYSVYQSPADILDNVIYKITAAKTEDESFFWSDMTPSGSPYTFKTYNFAADVTSAICSLSRVYDFTKANYSGVLVYRTRTVNSRVTYTQFVRGVDYTISTTAPSLEIIVPLEAGDSVTVKEYNQTYGSYIPNTPTKLGLYPATVPAVVTDSTYASPTQFIVGHDGSYNKLYGNYTNGQLDDFRDIVLLEFETRVYNNLKWTGDIPLANTDLFPGEFRTTDYTHEQLMPAYTECFMNWVGRNRIDYKTQRYTPGNEFSYNYNKSGDRLTGEPLKQGYWRGLYRWFYDTTNPAAAPWEMLGFTDKPTWWESHYGTDYSSNNTAMWADLRDGVVWNSGDSYIDHARVRPELLSVLPVDEAGNLRSPLAAVVGSFDDYSFKRGWNVGDEGPAESSYLRSSQWPFDLMRLLATFKPAKFYNLFADRDLYKYDSELGQYLFNGRYHLSPSELTVYGSGTAKHSYVNWVVDYLNQVGTDGATSVATTLKNIDMRLTYRMAGFSDKQYLKFLIERSTPTSNTPRLLIPDDSYDILLYDNVPEERIVYSSVIVQRTRLGWTVWGNSLNSPHFETTVPTPGPRERITVNSTTVELSTTYRINSRTPVAYGTEFYSIQGVSEFLRNYGRRQSEQGIQFQNITDGTPVDWTAMVREFMAWASQGWEIGSTISLNPNATSFSVYRSGLVVQPLTLQQENFVLNQNMIPLQPQNRAILRNNEEFSIQVLSVGDSVAYTNLNLSAIEHAIVFNNKTTFNDTIYQLSTGLRQNRIVMTGNKTANWNGFVDSNGFILNEGDIKEWSSGGKYPKGQIVTHKEFYWAANQLSEQQELFNYAQWDQVDYENIKRGLLPNPSTMAYEATKFYDINVANLEKDQDLLAFGLIGFRPRQYMVDAELTDISQVNVYINMISGKGTNKIADTMKGTTLVQGAVDYDVRENWAIKNGDFGGVMNSNFVEFLMNQAHLTGNPSLVGFSSALETVAGVNQTVDIKDFINYGRAASSANFLPVYGNDYISDRGLPTAGYVNIDDADFTVYSLEDLNLDSQAISDLYTSHYVWAANHQGTWDVFQPQSVGVTVETVFNNLDGTINITFSGQHHLLEDDPFVVALFDAAIDGYYTVKAVADLNTVTVVSGLSRATVKIVGGGVAMKLVTRRFQQSSDITVLPDTQFARRLAWIDSDVSGDWLVQTASRAYSVVMDERAATLGTSVAYSAQLGYVSTNGTNTIYQYGTTAATTVVIGATKLYSLIAAGEYLYCRSQNGVHVYTSVSGLLTLVETISISDTGAIAISSDRVWLYIANVTTATITVFMNTVSGYVLAYTLNGPALEGWGTSLATTVDGSRLVVGAPARDAIVGGIAEKRVGIAYIYSRSSETFQADGMTVTFTVANSTGGYAQVFVNSQPVTAIAVADQVTLAAAPDAGDTVTIEYGLLTLQQTVQSEAPHDEARFGNSVATRRYGADVVIGAPRELYSSLRTEGAVYHYVNAGQRYGTIICQPALPIATDTTVFIDGYRVVVPSGTNDLAAVAAIIEASEPTNVTATVSGDKLVISTRPGTSNTPGDQIDLVGASAADLTRLGIQPYTRTDIIYNPDRGVNTLFGWTVALNQESSLVNSLVIGAPTGTTRAATTFDFTDDSTHNDTLFDNGATTFIDSSVKAGAVYQFDLLSANTESIDNPDRYVFGQYCNAVNSDGVSTNTRWGESLAVANGVIMVGSPSWYANGDGRITVFTAAFNTSAWSVARQESIRVDINRVSNISIYDTLTNTTLDYLDYIDPVQGKMLSAVETNIDYISGTDPASYGAGLVWGAKQIGATWLDTTNLRMMNYSQADGSGIADNVYNSRYWGVAFPGSTADIYTWVSSVVEPVSYNGSGFVVNFDQYTSSQTFDRASGAVITLYYFWVKNYDRVPEGKTLSPSVLSQYILNPVNSGVAFMAPLATNAVALYNSGDNIQSNTSALHIGYSAGVSGSPAHADWSLIRDGDYSDFLSGVPASISGQPSKLYLKYLNSFMGAEILGGNLVALPDTTIPYLVRYGTGFRPRQTMFVDRTAALQNYIQYANNILIGLPITEIRGLFLLEQSGTIPLTGAYSSFSAATTYDVANYYTRTDWWAEGYSNSTKVIIEVPTYTDLLTLGQAQLYTGAEGLFLGLQTGLIARVTSNGQNLSETYVYAGTAGWTRIGLEKGTIQIKSALYSDTQNVPSMETYYIVRWLTEQVFVNELAIENNRTLMLMFKLIQSQSAQQNNYLPWLNKTSLIDVENLIRELRPYKKYQRDNQEIVAGYINEIKPYHVYIKQYILKYSGSDLYAMDFSDFDLPPKFDPTAGRYSSPQLVYSGLPITDQHLPSSDVWTEAEYTKWYNNYGLTVSNSEVASIPVTVLVPNDLITVTSLALTTDSITVRLQSTTAIPSTGRVSISGETISYSGVNYFTRTLTLDRTPARDYPVGTAAVVELPVLTASTYTLQVQNASSLPDSGVIMIDAEMIAYSSINRATGVISNVIRGALGTSPRDHSSSAEVFLVTAPVMVKSPGRGYTGQPNITAVIDTESTVALWVSGTSYGVGDRVRYNDAGFECVNNNSDLDFDGINWQPITIYPEPREVATFTANMAGDRLYSVTVTNAGGGYATLPRWVVEPSAIVSSWSAADVDLVTNQIYIAGHQFITGDSVVFSGTSNTGFPLRNGDYYYVCAIDADTIALYRSYSDAVAGWSTPSPSTALVVAVSGTVLTLDSSVFVTGSQVKLSTASGQFEDNYWVGRTDLTVSDQVSLYGTLLDARNGTNPLTVATTGSIISNVQSTDSVRISLEVANSGTLNVTAIIDAYTNEQPVREFKVGLKFDRTSYQYSPTDINAIWRIENLYKPTVNMFSFKTNDYDQLMEGTTYPNVWLVDPAFGVGEQYSFTRSGVDPALDTLVLQPAFGTAFVAPVQMLFIETPTPLYSTTFGMVNRNTYWFKAVTATTVAVYNTENDALNDVNRVALNDASAAGDIYTNRKLDSVVYSNNSGDHQYNIVTDPFEFGYGPEELVPGLVTDTINVIVTTKPGATWSPTVTATGLANSNIMEHTGFNMHRYTAVPATITLRDGTSVSNAVSFAGQITNPVNMALYAKAAINSYPLAPQPAFIPTGAMRRISHDDFVVDWVNQVIVINNPAIIAANAEVDVVLYEFGNGNQLIRSDSTIYAMSTVANPVPHTEILLDVPYESGTYIIDGITYNVEGISLPTAANRWQTAAVFANGVRVAYNDPLDPDYDPAAIMFTIQPQRTRDPVNDPYNPAKLVFNHEYVATADYLSFVVTSDLNGISGISIPQTQWFTGLTGQPVLNLTGFLGDDNLVAPSADNIILEINGVRYDGSAPTRVAFVADDQRLAYPAPVYGLSGFDPLNLTVSVNGVPVASDPTTWRPSYDTATQYPGGFDSDFGLSWGYFDNGTPFDNRTVLAIVFEPAYLATFVGDTITIDYDSATVPEVFTVTPNPGEVGGSMAILASVIPTDIISVTTFNRTTQQSLVTQSITDATVSRISAVVEATGAPVRVTTLKEHDLEPKDYVAINGSAAPDLDGNKYFVNIIDQFTVELYADINLTLPVIYINPGALKPMYRSYIQAINVNETPASPTPMTITQPDYGLFDTDRLWVTLIRPSNNAIDPDLRFYIPPSGIILLNNTLVLLEEVLPTDVLIVTSMVPTAMPSGAQFRINLNKYNSIQDATGWGIKWSDVWSPDKFINYVPAVHRENHQSRTYLTDTMATTLQLSDQFTVADPYRLVKLDSRPAETIVNGTIAGQSVNYVQVIGVATAHVTSVVVTVASTLTPVTDFAVEVVNNNIIRLVFSTSPAGLSVDIAVAIGDTVMIQSEQISFTDIDLSTGTVSGLKRGTNGTIVNLELAAGSPVYGVQNQDELSGYYYRNWYANKTDTVPMSLTSTVPAEFLQITV